MGIGCCSLSFVLLVTAWVIGHAAAGYRADVNHGVPAEPRRELSEDERQCRGVEDMLLIQGRIGEFPDGVPTFSVAIYNMCLHRRCKAHHVHVSCGDFATTTLINPLVFKRVARGDCLVKNGGGLYAGQSIFFTYANAAPYDLSISSVGYVCE